MAEKQMNDVPVPNGGENELAERESELVRLAAIKKKNTMRAIVSAIAFIVVTLIIFSAESFAYFSDNATSGTNRIAGGSVDVELITLTQIGSTDPAYTAPVTVMPATTVDKTVTVKNMGELPVYVRVKLDKKISDESGLPAGWQEMITCNLNLTDWTYKDGYYYYNEAISMGESTEALFDKVAFAASIGNEFVGKTVSFSIISEATQANGNGGSALDAQGWPASGN